MKNIRFNRTARQHAAFRNACYQAGFAAGVKACSENLRTALPLALMRGHQETAEETAKEGDDSVFYERMREHHAKKQES